MACYSPITGYRGPGGKVTFDRSVGWIDRPVKVPCGHCIGCRNEHARQWAVRCMHESQTHEANSFITLTYSEENLPDRGTLVLKDWQDFAKRFRKLQHTQWKKRGSSGKCPSFRFFHCGEYGDDDQRPHYHALIFGEDFGGDRTEWSGGNGKEIFRSETLEKLWPKGYSTVQELNWQTASYVTRYALKKVNGDKAEEHYARFDGATGEWFSLKPEYATMSRRPGIGAAWIEKFSTDVYPTDFVVIKGQKAKPPKYYDDQVEPVMKEAIIKKRRQQGIKHARNNTPERLRVRETVAIAKAKMKKREL